VGRKKSYRREALVSAARDLFHEHGFAGASTEMLVERLGVNRNSMYAEFGSKRGIFEAALEQYERMVVAALFGPLEAPGARIGQIDALFQRFAASVPGPASGRGCMLCNTAVELGGSDSDEEPMVGRYFERLQGAFKNALDGGRRAGELAEGVDTRDEARFLTATALGIFVMVRARATTRAVREAVRAARRHLQALQRRPGGSPLDLRRRP
jgi:TetR/AcrR family transcriptional repressor of nem operon